MNKQIDLDILDKEESVSVTEVIMTGFERVLISGTIESELKDDVEKIVLKIERMMQDLSEENTEISKFTLSRINESLKIILPIIQSEEIDHISLGIIIPYLKNIQDVSQIAIGKSSIEVVEELFKGFSIELLKDKLNNKAEVSIVSYAGMLKGIMKYATHQTNVLKFGDVASLFSSMPVSFSLTDVIKAENDINHLQKETSWDIELIISNKDDTKSIYSLWVFLESLKSINDLEIEIVDISKGSIKTKIKVWFKSEEARKEAEELINSTKKLAKGKLEKDFYENEKNKSESEKTIAEKDKIVQEIEVANSKEEKRKKELELEAMEIENENKRLQNERLKLQIFMEKRKALAELLATEVISSDDYKLIIDRELQIHKKIDETIEIGLLSEKK